MSEERKLISVYETVEHIFYLTQEEEDKFNEIILEEGEEKGFDYLFTTLRKHLMETVDHQDYRT